jgi:hypothetical protein
LVILSTRIDVLVIKKQFEDVSCTASTDFVKGGPALAIDISDEVGVACLSGHLQEHLCNAVVSAAVGVHEGRHPFLAVVFKHAVYLYSRAALDEIVQLAKVPTG